MPTSPKKKFSVSVDFKIPSLILSAVLMVTGLLLVWLRTRDPMIVLGVLLVSAALNLRIETGFGGKTKE